MWRRPWRRGTAEAERRRDVADEATKGIGELVEHSRAIDARLRAEVARNGFGELLQIAMSGRRGPERGQQA